MPKKVQTPAEEKLPKLFDLTGRVAVVTGGAGLLGSEFCRTLTEAGAAIFIADIDHKKSEALAASILKRGRQAFAIETDVSDPDSVQRMVAAASEKFGRLDILVNSAAIDPKFDPGHTSAGVDSVAFEDFPIHTWNQALAVNLTGVFLCCQAAAQLMLQSGGGVIVNLSSIYGLVGHDQRMYQRDGEAPQYKPVYYSVTKTGILGLTRYLATYYTGKNIRVNALSPGGVFNNHDESFLNAYSTRAVIGRMAEKDEMNGALLFLVSDASAYMTGANLVVDGGWTAW